MKKKTLLMVLLVASAVLLPLLAIRAQGDVDAGLERARYVGLLTYNMFKAEFL
jgi:hypothetical protein